jgi:hypothetical protein
VRGDPVDARSDLYSLGAALYEAVTGDTPFDGSTHFEIMSKHLAHAPAPPRTRGAPIPEALEAVILKALSKKPEDRWQTAREMIVALERILKIEGSNGRITGIASSLEPAVREVTTRTRPTPRRMGLWIALAVLVIGASAGVIVFARRAQGPATGASEQAAWVAPLLVPGLVARVDQTFEADKVRVLSSMADVDAARVARDYVIARGKFVGWLVAGKRLQGAAVIEPVTVVVATPEEICARELLGTVPADCRQKPYDWRYHIESRTLYLHKPHAADDTSLALASAEQVCKDQREILVGAGCVREGGVVTTYANDARLK